MISNPRADAVRRLKAEMFAVSALVPMASPPMPKPQPIKWATPAHGPTNKRAKTKAARKQAQRTRRIR